MVFGVTLRSAAALGLGAVLLMINDEVMGYVVPLMGHENHWLVRGFESVIAWGPTLLVVAVAVAMITNAIIRSEVGV